MRKLDIIVPMHNSSAFVVPLLESFNEQTCYDFRLIMVDDGSVDNTCELIEKNQKRLKYEVLLIRQENKGVGAARNKGFSFCTNEIVSYFDSDDFPETDYVETILESFSRESDIDSLIFSINTKKEGTDLRKPQSTGLSNGVYSSDELLHSFFEGRLHLYVFSIAIKRSLIKEHGASCPEGYANLEDVNYCYQLLSISKNIRLLNHSIYNYVIRLSSATSKYNVFNDWKKSVDVMRKLECFFEKECPEFYDYYKSFGIPKIVWTITWQSVKLAKSYKAFRLFTSEISSKKAMMVMKRFPTKRVSLSSKLFLFSPFLYYVAISLLGKNKNRSN